MKVLDIPGKISEIPRKVLGKSWIFPGKLRDSKESTRKVLDIPGKAQRFKGKSQVPQEQRVISSFLT